MWLANTAEHAFTERKKKKGVVGRVNNPRKPNNKFRAIVETLTYLDPEPFLLITSKHLSMAAVIPSDCSSWDLGSLQAEWRTHSLTLHSTPLLCPHPTPWLLLAPRVQNSPVVFLYPAHPFVNSPFSKLSTKSLLWMCAISFPPGSGLTLLICGHPAGQWPEQAFKFTRWNGWKICNVSFSHRPSFPNRKYPPRGLWPSFTICS